MNCSWKWASSLKCTHIVYAISMFEMSEFNIPVSPLSSVESADHFGFSFFSEVTT